MNEDESADHIGGEDEDAVMFVIDGDGHLDRLGRITEQMPFLKWNPETRTWETGSSVDLREVSELTPEMVNERFPGALDVLPAE